MLFSKYEESNFKDNKLSILRIRFIFVSFYYPQIGPVSLEHLRNLSLLIYSNISYTIDHRSSFNDKCSFLNITQNNCINI